MRRRPRCSCARIAASTARSWRSRKPRTSSRARRSRGTSSCALVGARDLSDFERLVTRGEIRFARNAGDRVRRLRRCRQARHRASEHRGAHGRDHRRQGDRLDRRDRPVDGARARLPQSRIFAPHLGALPAAAQTPERLNTRVIDALKQLNFEGEVVAAGPQSGRRSRTKAASAYDRADIDRDAGRIEAQRAGCQCLRRKARPSAPRA